MMQSASSSTRNRKQTNACAYLVQSRSKSKFREGSTGGTGETMQETICERDEF